MLIIFHDLQCYLQEILEKNDRGNVGDNVRENVRENETGRNN